MSGKNGNTNPELKVGDRVYCYGDVCNSPAWMQVKAVRAPTRFSGTSYELLFDHETDCEIIADIQIDRVSKGNSSTRFVTEQAYNDFRQTQIKSNMPTELVSLINSQWIYYDGLAIDKLEVKAITADEMLDAYLMVPGDYLVRHHDDGPDRSRDCASVYRETAGTWTCVTANANFIEVPDQDNSMSFN